MNFPCQLQGGIPSGHSLRQEQEGTTCQGKSLTSRAGYTGAGNGRTGKCKAVVQMISECQPATNRTNCSEAPVLSKTRKSVPNAKTFETVLLTTEADQHGSMSSTTLL